MEASLEPADLLRENLNALFAKAKAERRTQDSIAEAAGVTQGQISLWKGGTLPSVGNLPGLASAFGLTVDALFRKDGWKSAEQDSLDEQISATARQIRDDGFKKVILGHLHDQLREEEQAKEKGRKKA